MPMGLIPRRSKSMSKKQKAAGAAAAVWAGKRSGKVVRGVAIAIVGIVTLKALRSRMGKHEEPAAAEPFPDTTPVPDPGQPAAGSPINGSAPQPDPAAPFSPPVPTGTTPPQGDKAADLMDEDPRES
jgi:hypothetical protein